MPVYYVTTKEEVTNVYTVEADTEEEAQKMEDILSIETYSSESLEIIDVEMVKT